MKMFLRGCITLIILLFLWQLVIWLFHFPNYILPSPIQVFRTWIIQMPLILYQMRYTLLETILGLIFGSVIGILSALAMVIVNPIRYGLLPLLIISQALPTFVIAPLLVLWFGYGMASKIVIAMIMLFFPVTSSLYDGLRSIPSAWLDMSKIIHISRWKLLWRIQIPAALPSLSSGLRVATTFAPMGAIIGEWVGSSQGLGFLMLNANARMQIDMVFACLMSIIILALLLYFFVDYTLRKLIFW